MATNSPERERQPDEWQSVLSIKNVQSPLILTFSGKAITQTSIKDILDVLKRKYLGNYGTGNNADRDDEYGRGRGRRDERGTGHWGSLLSIRCQGSEEAVSGLMDGGEGRDRRRVRRTEESGTGYTAVRVQSPGRMRKPDDERLFLEKKMRLKRR